MRHLAAHPAKGRMVTWREAAVETVGDARTGAAPRRGARPPERIPHSGLSARTHTRSSDVPRSAPRPATGQSATVTAAATPHAVSTSSLTVLPSQDMAGTPRAYDSPPTHAAAHSTRSPVNCAGLTSPLTAPLSTPAWPGDAARSYGEGWPVDAVCSPYAVPLIGAAGCAGAELPGDAACSSGMVSSNGAAWCAGVLSPTGAGRPSDVVSPTAATNPASAPASPAPAASAPAAPAPVPPPTPTSPAGASPTDTSTVVSPLTAGSAGRVACRPVTEGPALRSREPRAIAAPPRSRKTPTAAHGIVEPAASTPRLVSSPRLASSRAVARPQRLRGERALLPPANRLVARAGWWRGLRRHVEVTGCQRLAVALPTPVRTPFTFCYAVVLVATGLFVALADPGVVHGALEGSSSDASNLVHRPLLALIASGLWVAGGLMSPSILLFLLVLGALERRVGGWRTAGVFALGHVLATLLTELPVAVSVASGHLPPSSLDRLDYGISYGLFASLAALTGLLARWARWTVLTGVGTMLVIDLIELADPLTNWGHVLAVLIGVGCWPPLRSRVARASRA